MQPRRLLAALKARAPKLSRSRALIALAIALAPVVLLLATAAFTPLPPELNASAPTGVRVVDKDDFLLREVRADDGARARPLALSEVGEPVIRALIAAEDHRFFHHPGVDLLAVVRAVGANAWNRRIVSGASTLTMQLARTLRPHRRSAWGKWREAALALRIEWSYSKNHILEAYLNAVEFGPNLRGIGAASHAYFGKAPRQLSLAEAALLAGLPRGPSLYAVTKHPERARLRRDRVLKRMLEAGWISEDKGSLARGEPITTRRERSAFGAPHLVDGLVAAARGRFTKPGPPLPGETVVSAVPIVMVQPNLEEALAAGVPRSIATTIDGRVQRAVESAALALLAPLAARHVTAASVVVVDNATSNVIAYVGSPDFFDAKNLGQNDGARARRQPGSTLKPFLYALAMEKLGFTAATVLPDVELHVALPGGGDYAPRNYDDKFHGPVRLRQALGNSLNVPAVWTAVETGIPALLQRLRELHFESLAEGPDFYGPGLALGDGEVTLLELARAYATLARGGIDKPLRFVRSLERTDGTSVSLPEGGASRVLPEEFTDVVTDILRDPNARLSSFDNAEALAFAFDVAAKTGTSKGFRDNWTLGYSSEVTVATWVGNFDGSPMDNVSGITGAAPLFHAAMMAGMVGRTAHPLPIDLHADHGGGRLSGGAQGDGGGRLSGGAQGDGGGRLSGGAQGDGLRRVSVCPLSGRAPGRACGGAVFEWLPSSVAESLPPCDMHEDVALDRHNGLRAGPDCQGSAVEHRRFERYGPEFAAWAIAAGRPVAPAQGSPACPPAEPAPEADPSALTIVYPHDGARFVLDPERPRDLQKIPVTVMAPAGVREVALRLDGVETRLRGPAFSSFAKLEPGEHTITAQAVAPRRDGVEATVRFSVR